MKYSSEIISSHVKCLQFFEICLLYECQARWKEPTRFPVESLRCRPLNSSGRPTRATSTSPFPAISISPPPPPIFPRVGIWNAIEKERERERTFPAEVTIHPDFHFFCPNEERERKVKIEANSDLARLSPRGSPFSTGGENIIKQSFHRTLRPTLNGGFGRSAAQIETKFLHRVRVPRREATQPLTRRSRNLATKWSRALRFHAFLIILRCFGRSQDVVVVGLSLSPKPDTGNIRAPDGQVCIGRPTDRGRRTAPEE